MPKINLHHEVCARIYKFYKESVNVYSSLADARSGCKNQKGLPGSRRDVMIFRYELLWIKEVVMSSARTFCSDSHLWSWRRRPRLIAHKLVQFYEIIKKEEKTHKGSVHRGYTPDYGRICFFLAVSKTADTYTTGFFWVHRQANNYVWTWVIRKGKRGSFVHFVHFKHMQGSLLYPRKANLSSV